MKKQHIKRRNIYIFLITLSIIGLVTGFLYYEFQPKNIKTDIINKLNIQDELNNRINNLPKRIKETSKILFYSVLIIPSVGGEVKFACVDGPEFDGHQVDFAELMSRNTTYRCREAEVTENHSCRIEAMGKALIK